VFHNADLAPQVVAYGGKRYLHLAPVGLPMRAAFGEDTETKVSEVVASVSCTLEALTTGWSISPTALRKAAAVSVL